MSDFEITCEILKKMKILKKSHVFIILKMCVEHSSSHDKNWRGRREYIFKLQNKIFFITIIKYENLLLN